MCFFIDFVALIVFMCALLVCHWMLFAAVCFVTPCLFPSGLRSLQGCVREGGLPLAQRKPWFCHTLLIFKRYSFTFFKKSQGKWRTSENVSWWQYIFFFTHFFHPHCNRRLKVSLKYERLFDASMLFDAVCFVAPCLFPSVLRSLQKVSRQMACFRNLKCHDKDRLLRNVVLQKLIHVFLLPFPSHPYLTVGSRRVWSAKGVPRRRHCSTNAHVRRRRSILLSHRAIHDQIPDMADLLHAQSWSTCATSMGAFVVLFFFYSNVGARQHNLIQNSRTTKRNRLGQNW